MCIELCCCGLFGLVWVGDLVGFVVYVVLVGGLFDELFGGIYFVFFE